MTSRKWLHAVHPAHRRVARAAAWVGVFVLIGRLAGGAKEMAVAYKYGVGGLVDAYHLATTMVTWIPVTIVSVLTVILVPLLVSLRQQSSVDRVLFIRELRGSILLLGAGLAGASLAFCAIVLPLATQRLTVSTSEMILLFTLGMSPIALLVLVNGINSARLMAKERQINTLLESVPAVAVLSFVLLWPSSVDIGPILWGTVVGIAVQTIWLEQLARQADGVSAMPLFTRRSIHWREFYKAAAVMVAGQFVMSLITPLDQYYAAQLGEGAISSMGYANRIIALILGMGAMAVSRAALPVLAELQESGQTRNANSITLKWAFVMLIGGLVVSVIGWTLAPLIVKLLFQRGAFTEQDTAIVAEVFCYGLLQVPFYFAALIMVQLLASRRRFAIIAWFAAASFLVKWALNAVLTPLLGILGIALATGLMYALTAMLLLLAVTRLDAEVHRT